MILMVLVALSACQAPWECVIPAGSAPDYSQQLGCVDDFEALASEPLDASIPGARSVKTVVDRVDDDALYFQNSELFTVHWEFAWEHLSGDGLPMVSELGTFNTTEYYSPTRRFLLGTVTSYQEPGVWAYEIAPWDTADAEMITSAYLSIRDNAYFGDELVYHPTSAAQEDQLGELPNRVETITTDELYAGISYQPLNLGCSMGSLGFYADADLVSPREIVVLDAVPNDISVVSGVVTATWQTPLSHVNVLSQNRGTPNMALRGAWSHPELRALEGQWVELCVDPMDWSIREVTQAEADAWWEDFRPEPLEVTPMDLSVTDLRDDDQLLDLEAHDLAEALAAAVPAFGGKAAHYGGLATLGAEVPHPRAFAIPVFYYHQHLEQAGLSDQIEAMLADPDFLGDAAVRRERLAELRRDIEEAPMDADFLALVLDKLDTGYPGTRMRFRSSTNAEDLSGFNGAGLYDSESATPGDTSDPVDQAIKNVWASLWRYRAYEEREYFSIPHTDIGMAVLVHHSFPDEEANGVAITANIYDTTGLEPAFYVNVQLGEESVVQPEAGVSSDVFLSYWYLPGQPIVYLGSSSLVEEGETVLSAHQVHELGAALATIHDRFAEVYGGTREFYGMDVEFKFDDDWDDDPDDEPRLWVKQARPYPGWGG